MSKSLWKRLWKTLLNTFYSFKHNQYARKWNIFFLTVFLANSMESVLLLWWLICAMSYKRVFGAKTRKVATRKPAKWWFWRVFEWRPFASPGKDTTNNSPKRNAWNVAYFCVAGRKVAMRKHEKVTIWRFFLWRPLAFSPLLERRERSPSESRQNHNLTGFRMANFRPARQRYDKQ